MRKCVLVVEDNALLGLDIAGQLKDAGFDVLGPAISVANAFKLMTTAQCDAAVLDVNLGNETAEPIAIELRALGRPFIVLSGYSSDQHPPGFKGAPALTKPVRPEELAAVLNTCLAQSSGSPSLKSTEQSGTATRAVPPHTRSAPIQRNVGSDTEDGG